MALLISTNMYKAEEFKRVLSYVAKWKGQVGVEVFPMFHQQIFASLLEGSMDILSHVPISFHGPYYKAEHSALQGSADQGSVFVGGDGAVVVAVVLELEDRKSVV